MVVDEQVVDGITAQSGIPAIPYSVSWQMLGTCLPRPDNIVRDRQYVTDLVGAHRGLAAKGARAAFGRLGSPDRLWTADRLSRAVHRFAWEGLGEPDLITPMP